MSFDDRRKEKPYLFAAAHQLPRTASSVLVYGLNSRYNRTAANFLIQVKEK